MDAMICSLMPAAGMTETTLAVAAIALWVVIVCLKTIGQDIDDAERWHKLETEANGLRQKQLRRLKELGVKSRR